MAVEDLSPPPKKEDAKFDNWLYRLWKRARASVDYTVVGATDPILATTGTGTIGISHNTSGVIPGTYGGTLGLPQVVVNTYGHVIAGTSFPLQATTPVLIGSNAGTYTWGHATSGVTTGTYGAAGIIAAVNLDTYGHVRAVTTFAIAPAGTNVTGADVVGTSPILLGGTTTNAVLRPFTVHHATSGVLPSTYGGTFGKPQLVINTYGHVTSGTNVADMPQRIQNGNYTLVLGDGGCHIFREGTSTGIATHTTPANASVAYTIGTPITFVNYGTGNLILTVASDELRFLGTGATGNRTLAQYGQATILKVLSTGWTISGVGVS